jgi:hypothetical protein
MYEMAVLFLNSRCSLFELAGGRPRWRRGSRQRPSTTSRRSASGRRLCDTPLRPCQCSSARGPRGCARVRGGGGRCPPGPRRRPVGRSRRRRVASGLGSARRKLPPAAVHEATRYERSGSEAFEKPPGPAPSAARARPRSTRPRRSRARPFRARKTFESVATRGAAGREGRSVSARSSAGCGRTKRPRAPGEASAAGHSAAQM